jgi:hypothetical protein
MVSERSAVADDVGELVEEGVDLDLGDAVAAGVLRNLDHCFVSCDGEMTGGTADAAEIRPYKGPIAVAEYNLINWIYVLIYF